MRTSSGAARPARASRLQTPCVARSTDHLLDDLTSCYNATYYTCHSHSTINRHAHRLIQRDFSIHAEVNPVTNTVRIFCWRVEDVGSSSTDSLGMGEFLSPTTSRLRAPPPRSSGRRRRLRSSISRHSAQGRERTPGRTARVDGNGGRDLRHRPPPAIRTFGRRRGSRRSGRPRRCPRSGYTRRGWRCAHRD